MYIRRSSVYYVGTEQHIRKAPFLMLFQSEESAKKKEIKGIVRMVAMSQVGHFMIGRARIKGHTIILSGSYGNDGLPIWNDTIYNMLPDSAIMPSDLYDKWNSGNGWNSAGNEANDMRIWAIKNIEGRF